MRTSGRTNRRDTALHGKISSISQFGERSLKKKAKRNKHTQGIIQHFWRAQRNFPCRIKSAIIRRLRKNTAGRWQRWQGGPAVADQVPLCWSLDFTQCVWVWISAGLLYLCISFTTCTLDCDLRKTRLQPHLPDCNHCASTGHDFFFIIFLWNSIPNDFRYDVHETNYSGWLCLHRNLPTNFNSIPQ